MLALFLPWFPPGDGTKAVYAYPTSDEFLQQLDKPEVDPH
jgi:hypothetical protein